MSIENEINVLQEMIEVKSKNIEKCRHKAAYYDALNKTLRFNLGYSNSSDSEEDDNNEWERELVSIINHKPFRIFGKEAIGIKKKEEINVKDDEHEKQVNKSKKKKTEDIKPKLKTYKKKKEIDFSICGTGYIGKALVIINYLKTLKYASDFLQPVDPVKLLITDYYQHVTKPMDLGTVEKKLKEGAYPTSAKGLRAWVCDVRQTFMNAVEYNPPKHYVAICAIKLSNKFESLLKSAEFGIKIPLPLGLARSSRWYQPLGWRRHETEEILIYGKKKDQIKLSYAEKRKFFIGNTNNKMK